MKLTFFRPFILKIIKSKSILSSLYKENADFSFLAGAASKRKKFNLKCHINISEYSPLLSQLFAYNKCSDAEKKTPRFSMKGKELYFSSQTTFTWSKNIFQGLEDKAVCWAQLWILCHSVTFLAILIYHHLLPSIWHGLRFLIYIQSTLRLCI